MSFLFIQIVSLYYLQQCAGYGYFSMLLTRHFCHDFSMNAIMQMFQNMKKQKNAVRLDEAKFDVFAIKIKHVKCTCTYNENH